MKIDENILEWANRFIKWFSKDSYFPVHPDFTEDGEQFVISVDETHNDEDYSIYISVMKKGKDSDSR